MSVEEAIEVDDREPFAALEISDAWMKLNSLNERTNCQQCKKSRKYFCYTCFLPVPGIADYIPLIELPLKLDIIKHSKEIDGKSTAIHAAVLCPKDVNIYTYPMIPNYSPEDDAVLVFPGNNATSIEQHIAKLASSLESNSTSTALPIRRFVLIDSTWNQCKGIYKDPRLRVLPCVVLKKRITQFWRHQNGSPRWHLSTIEAAHQFLVEFHEAKRKNFNSSTVPYSGQYDNLLFFFRFMYNKIHTLYDHDNLQSYKRPLM